MRAIMRKDGAVVWEQEMPADWEPPPNSYGERAEEIIGMELEGSLLHVHKKQIVDRFALTGREGDDVFYDFVEEMK